MRTFILAIGLAALTVSASGQSQSPTLTGASQASALADRSVADVLNLSGTQLVQLDQLYDYVNGVREDEERKLAKRPNPSQKDRDNADKNVRKAFDTAQREAKKTLSAGQVYLLGRFPEEIGRGKDATYRLLFAGTLEEFLAQPVDARAAQRWRDAKDGYAKGYQLSPYANNPNWRPGLSLGFGLGHHHHWHGGHIHQHRGGFGFGIGFGGRRR